MFGVDWNDPQTIWLNLANLALGLVTIACVAMLVYAVAAELLARWRKSAVAEGLDHEVSNLVASYKSGHAIELPGLGLTMADGGEPVKPPAAPPRKPRTRKS
jgi:hypothetical protein